MLFTARGRAPGVDVWNQEFASDLLQSLDVVDAGDLADAVDYFLKVFQVRDFQDYVYVGLAVLGAG